MTTSAKTLSEAGPIYGQAAVARKHRIGPVVVASFVAGLLTAAAFAVVAFGGAEEHVVTGTVMLAFAFGWALLATCSRWTDQPQRWAAVPAAFMGLVGASLLILAPDANALHALGWVWPPALLALVVWMTLQARRQLRSRTRRWVLYPVFGVLVLASLGGASETVQESLYRPALPAGGELVDVGGHRLYLQCSGSGSPTVVLEAGLGEGSSAWSTISPTVARQTRVCIYDRAGLGWSEAATRSRNGTQTATDLHTLLTRAGEPGPYMLVGHSLGGAYALDYAQQFPAQVAGVALIDSMSPEQFTRVSGYAGFYERLHRVSGLLPSLARLGVGRIVGYGALDARGLRDEVAGIPDALERAGGLDSIGDKPLIVVTAGKGQKAGWASAQNDLARLSTNSVHRVVPGATHASLVEDRADAAVTSRAIRDVVRSVRAARPLASS